MKNQFALILTLTLFLIVGMGVAYAASDSSLEDGTQVAQFSDMKGQGAAADAEGSAADDFDDFEDDEYASTGNLVADPLSGWNKVWFYFNDAMFHGVMKPVSTGYAWLLPEKPRQWVRNFFANLLFPVRFVNDLLQGKWDAAYMETSKFIANTVWGFGGLGDVTAGRPKNWMPDHPTADGLGQTLGKYGIGHGMYLVWPFLGPSSLRESVGWVGDTYLNPLTYTDLSWLELGGIWAFKNVNNLSLQLRGNEYEALTDGAIDKYAAVKNAYIRFRAKKVQE